MLGKITLKDEKIINHWSIIVENARGLAEQIYSVSEAPVKDDRVKKILVGG